MAREEEKKIPREKISPVFAARLRQIGPEEKVRALIMLETGDARAAVNRRLTKTTRRAAVKKTRQAVEEVLTDIDGILKRHNGKRLKSEIDLLGTIPVITTPAGIEALTVSEHVKAIFEDQTIFRVA